jgi:hypothetical protein
MIPAFRRGLRVPGGPTPASSGPAGPGLVLRRAVGTRVLHPGRRTSSRREELVLVRSSGSSIGVLHPGRETSQAQCPTAVPAGAVMAGRGLEERVQRKMGGGQGGWRGMKAQPVHTRMRRPASESALRGLGRLRQQGGSFKSESARAGGV